MALYTETLARGLRIERGAAVVVRSLFGDMPDESRHLALAQYWYSRLPTVNVEELREIAAFSARLGRRLHEPGFLLPRSWGAILRRQGS